MPDIKALFMMSPMQAAGHKMAVLMIIFFCHFQTSIFIKQDKKLSEQLPQVFLFFFFSIFIPFLSEGLMMHLPFGSPLMISNN